MSRRSHIPVDRPPPCPECGHKELKPLDDYVVSFVYKCQACGRGFQLNAEARPKNVGWERVVMYFDYENAPMPEYEDLYGGSNGGEEEG